MGFKVKRKDQITKEFLVHGLRAALLDDTKYREHAFEEAWCAVTAKVTEFLESVLEEPGPE